MLAKHPGSDPASARDRILRAASRLFYEETDLEGPYRARAVPLNLDATFAANPDPIESDPLKLDRNALAAAVPGWNFDYRDDVGSLFKDASSVSLRGELHRPLLWTVLALLLVETFLAWRFGHHR